MATLGDLGVVISVERDDTSWIGLLDDLVALPLNAEILFTGPKMPTAALSELRRLSSGRKVRWIPGLGCRGLQWNQGARVTEKAFLWFLTSGARFTPRTLPALEKSLRRAPQSLHYFDLRFLEGSGRPTHFRRLHFRRLNDVLAWSRSHFLALPLGNQGFCLSRANFEKLGGFPGDGLSGEDHLLIWKAHQSGVALACTGAQLRWDARSFEEDGWAWTTLRNGRILIEQAVPECLAFFRRKRGD